MERSPLATFHDRYERLDPDMLRALIAAHQTILRHNRSEDIDERLRTNTELGIFALQAELASREGK